MTAATNVGDGLDFQQLMQRMASDLSLAATVWVSPDLVHLLELLALGQPSDPPTATVDVAVVQICELANDGSAITTFQPPAATRIVGVFGYPPRIVRELPSANDHPVQLARAYAAMGIIDVGTDELIITELAAGVSAKDLQQFAEPTLKISSRVAMMQDNVLAPST